MKKRPESEITSAVNSTLDRLGIWHFKHHGGCRHCGMYGRAGVSDVHAIHRGKSIWIEVKEEGWKPPGPGDKARYKHYSDQRQFIDEVRASGGVGFFAQSVDDVIHGLGHNEIVTLARKRVQEIASGGIVCPYCSETFVPNQ